MNTRNRAFQFANPYGSSAAAPATRGRGRQQDYQQFDDEQDPEWEVQAYMKIGFRLNNGKTKFLKLGKTDKQLRTGSPLEAMILSYWEQGGDLNELVKTMVIEINDAHPDELDGDVDFAFDFPAEVEAKPAKSRSRKTEPALD